MTTTAAGRRPAKADTITVELDEGDYELYCPVDGHRDNGMEGTLVVGGGGATTDEDQTGTVGTEPDTDETETGETETDETD